MKRSHLEIYFESILKKMKLRFEREFRFHPVRKWRFDFCIPAMMIAVEVEGGVWMGSGGAHNRGKGFLEDIEKYNEATVLGWRLLRYGNVKQMDEFKRHYEEIKGRAK